MYELFAFKNFILHSIFFDLIIKTDYFPTLIQEEIYQTSVAFSHTLRKTNSFFKFC